MKYITSSLWLLLISIILVFAISSCDISDNKPKDQAQSFHLVYDLPDFDVSYTAVDIQQTIDGGYMVLQESPASAYKAGSILSVDKEGKLIAQVDFPEGVLLTCGDLMSIDSTIYAIGTRENTAVILGIKDSVFSEPVPIQGPNASTGANEGITTPVAAATANTNQIILMGADISGDEVVTRVALTDIDGVVSGSILPFGLDSDDPSFVDGFQKEINEHLDGVDRRLPFFVGQMLDGTYFFNGIYKSSLSLAFTDLSSAANIWEVQGSNRTLAPTTALVNTNGNNFAISRYNTTDNFLTPNYTLNVNLSGGLINNVDIDSLTFNEIEEYTTTKVKVIEVGSKQVAVFGSTTRDGRIILVGFDAIDGSFLGSKYYGFSVPHEFGNFIQTQDKGLAIVGTAFVAGRFKRTSFFKVSAESIADWGG